MHDNIVAIPSNAHAILAQLIDPIVIAMDGQLIDSIAMDAQVVDCVRDSRTLDRFDRGRYACNRFDQISIFKECYIVVYPLALLDVGKRRDGATNRRPSTHVTSNEETDDRPRNRQCVSMHAMDDVTA